MIQDFGCTTRRACGLLLAAAIRLGAPTPPARGLEQPQGGLRVVEEKDAVRILAGDREVLEYRSVPSPLKPYVSRLFTPGGVQVLRDSPSDHKHHHALMFALAADKVNFWEETAGAGTEAPRSTKVLTSGGRSAGESVGLTQSVDWMKPGEPRPLLVEQRTVEVLRTGEAGATLVTWRSQLAAPPGGGKVELSGAHYFGLGMRFVESMDRGGRFFNAGNLEGEVVRGSERLTPVRWCGYAASADDHPVTVAIFDHPSNPRHPNRIFTMTAPFAYLAATLNLWKETITLAPGAPLHLSYGVALWDGTISPDRIEALYRSWAR